MDDANRRLAGILAADVVGYSAMIGKDEPATLARVRTLRTDLIEPVAATHGGRLFKTTGDGFLAAFASAVQALRCANAIQERLNAQPDGLRLRIGVHQGEVVAEGDDLLGDGVIIAARLEPLAEPGGICISARVREDAAGKMALQYDDLGTPELKNIAAKIQVFRVRLTPAERPALPLPDKPSIAVLPFANLSADPEQEFFSDGVADDIITELSRSRSLFVIARTSSFTYRGRVVDIRQIARELGVRYMLEGSVRRGGGRVRVVAQLIDAETGNHIWAERYDRAPEDVFAVQDEIAEAVSTAILPAIGDAEQRRVLRKPPSSLSAWETYQRGMWHLSKGSPAEHEQARVLFRQAAEIDPNFAAPFVGVALTYVLDVSAYGVRYPGDVAPIVEAEARKAIAIDPNDSEGHAMLACALAYTGNLGVVSDCAERALALNRNSALGHIVRGVSWVHAARLAEGRDDLLLSLRLDPRSPLAAAVLGTVAGSYYFEGNYIGAVEIARRCVAAYPSHGSVRRFLVAALGQLGKTEEAREALREFSTVAPDAFDSTVRHPRPWFRPEHYEHMLDGLRKAGWQG
jgi:adenylate cyclase